MYVEQLYTNCLAHAAYYIESNGEAAIIDPLRDIQQYITLAQERNTTIKYVFETHFHADFVSGHVDLAKAHGAHIVFGPTAKPKYDAIVGTDNQLFKIGNISLQLLHTPGHTPESCCFLLYDEAGTPKMIFTGDTLFLGDVGRPDLAQKAANMSQEELAGILYDSLQNKILPLPDDIIVYPGHGAGSACGKKMSDATVDTLGHQKATNYALRPGIDRSTFIKEVTTGLTTPPVYFPFNVSINKSGYGNINEVLKHGTQPLKPAIFQAKAQNALIIDIRPAQTFAHGFIPGAINIGIAGDFAPWVGRVITDIAQPIILVGDDNQIEEAVKRLARVGYDNCLGYLEGGISAWLAAGKPIDTIESISAEHLADLCEQHKNCKLLDVRRHSEYESEHVSGAINMPLDNLYQHAHDLDKQQQYYVYCAAGYRSMIFTSILRKMGYHNLIDINGGFKAIKNGGRLFTTTYKEPITML